MDIIEYVLHVWDRIILAHNFAVNVNFQVHA